MDKKISLIVGALVLVTYQLQATSGFKSGIRIGVGGGYKHHKVSQKNNWIVSQALLGLGPGSESSKKSSSKDSGQFDVHVGYDFMWSSVYSALELSYRYSPDKNKVTVQAQNPGPTTLSTNPFLFHQRHRHDFGLSGHLGYEIISNFIPYGIFNLRLGRFEESFSGNSVEPGLAIRSAKKSKTRFGYGGGLGLKYALPAFWSIAAEATYNVYEKIKIKGDLQPGLAGQFSVESGRPETFNLLLKVSKTL